MSLTVFANFLINDEERLNRLKESFFSFYKCNIDYWIINVRGNYNSKVSNFLLKHLSQDNLNLSFIESKNGWFYVSKQIVKNLKTSYVFIWNEDHINQAGYEKFNNIFDDIEKKKLDIFFYSFFNKGASPDSFKLSQSKETQNIIYLENNIKILKKRISNMERNKIGGPKFIISLASIISSKLFVKVLTANDPPIRRWPKNTPFDFEKNQNDVHWLPLKTGVSKFKFFEPEDENINYRGENLSRLEKNKFNVKNFMYIKIRELINKIVSRYILKI